MRDNAKHSKLQRFSNGLKRTHLRSLGDKLARLYSESKFYNHVRTIQEEIGKRKASGQVQ